MSAKSLQISDNIKRMIPLYNRRPALIDYQHSASALPWPCVYHGGI